MMESSDEFAVWIARAFLREEEDAVQVAVLDALVEDAGRGPGLNVELERSATSEPRAGAFGMEIAGAIIVPILVKIGQELWATYAKELTAKVGKDMATLTTDRIKQWLKARTRTGQHDTVKAELEDAIRRVGAVEKLTEHQISALISAVRGGQVIEQLSAN